MAGTTKAGTQDPGPAAELSDAEKAEIRASDTADVTQKKEADLSGKRLRAIPTVVTRNGDRGTRVELRAQDFEEAFGITHDTVVFDYFKDNFTLPVGDAPGEISKEAADKLIERSPYSYEYMDDGK